MKIEITGIPHLPLMPQERRDCVQALAEEYGRRTVVAGFNRAEDMPSPEAYSRAAGVVVEMISLGSIDLALLVNLIADVESIGTTGP